MAQAKWLVMVDWNDDATSDVRGLTLEHFRDLSNEHIEAARLELELNNDDHKYSPSNSGSPLSGDLKPGRKAWVRAAYPFDGFSGAAGTQLQDHEPEYDSGFAWAEHLQGFDIAPGGTAAQTDGTQGNGDCVATLDFADADVSFGCDFNRGTDTTDHGGLCSRFLDASNYLYVRITGSVIELRKVDAGADSLVASAAHTWGTSTGKFLQAVLHGDSIHGSLWTARRCWTRHRPSTARQHATACSPTMKPTIPGTTSAAGYPCFTAPSTRFTPGPGAARNTATSGHWTRWSV